MLFSFGHRIFFKLFHLPSLGHFGLIEAFSYLFAKNQSQILAAYTEPHGENDLGRD